MAKKILSLSSDGKAVLKLPGGKTVPITSSYQRISSAYLLIDCSSSMAGHKLAQARMGLLEFAEDAISKSYAVGIIRFASTADLVVDLSTSIEVLRPAIDALESAGSTNMTDAINLAAQHLSLRDGMRAIVIASDGSPDSRETALNAAARAKAMRIDIITIRTPDADREFLQQIASRPDLAIQVMENMLASGIAKAANLLTSGESGAS